MDHFFLSLALISAGGVLPLFFWRHFGLMKTASVGLLTAGSFLGLVDAGKKLFHPDIYAVSIEYLNAFSLSFRIDPLSAFFLVAIHAVSMLAAIYSFNYMDNRDKALGTAVNYLFFSLLVAAMALVVAADNMLTFLLSWEIMSLSSFFLVIYNYQSAENRKAGYLYFIFSQVGAMFILAAFAVLYAHTGSFAFAAASDVSRGVKILVFVLAFVGFGSKAGVFPFHVWLPHAHPAAPSHISAVMSGVMIKTGIYGIIRIYVMLNFHSQLVGAIVLIAGIVSGILGVVYALGQHDLKRLLAYHSVENIGIILIGLGIGMIGTASGQPLMAVLGFSGGLLHVLNHSIFKSLLFMGAGVVLKNTGTRSIDSLGGLLKRMKITGTTFLIGSLAISGLPPFNGFVSEFLIYMGSFHGVGLSRSAFVLSLLGIVSLAIIGGLALACFSKVVGVVFQGEPRSRAAEHSDEKGPAMLLPMLILAAACILIGVYPKTFVIMALQAVGAMGLPFERIPIEPFISITGNITQGACIFISVLVLIGILRSFLYKNKTVTRSGTWGCGFTQPTARMQYTGSSYAASVLAFFKAFAPLTEDHPAVRGRFPARTHYHSRIHDIAELYLDGVIIRPVMTLFDKLRWIQHGDIHLYIGYILLAIVVLLFFI